VTAVVNKADRLPLEGDRWLRLIDHSTHRVNGTVELPGSKAEVPQPAPCWNSLMW